ncbi:hypothetical protein OS493_039235, partial [Desmophyllum pertusum]
CRTQLNPTEPSFSDRPMNTCLLSKNGLRPSYTGYGSLEHVPAELDRKASMYKTDKGMWFNARLNKLGLVLSDEVYDPYAGQAAQAKIVLSRIPKLGQLTLGHHLNDTQEWNSNLYIHYVLINRLPVLKTDDQETSPLAVAGSSALLLVLSSFTWIERYRLMNVHRIFTHSRWSCGKSTRKLQETSHVICLYAWGSPAIVVLICLVVDHVKKGSYWIWARRGGMFHISASSHSLFVCSACCTAFDLQSVCIDTHGDSYHQDSKGTRQVTNQRHNTSVAVICVKMASVMGVTWILGIAANVQALSFLWYPYVVLSSLQGICRDCRSIIDATETTPIRVPGTPSIADITDSIGNITLDKDRCPVHSTPITPGGSFYLPPCEATSSDVSLDMQIPQNRPIDALNTYLVSRDVSPIRSQLQTSWEEASGRTKRYYTRKAKQGVAAVVQDITPHETGPLFRALCSSDELRRQLSSDEDSDEDTVDVTLMGHFPNVSRLAAAGRRVARYFPSWQTRGATANSSGISQV